MFGEDDVDGAYWGKTNQPRVLILGLQSVPRMFITKQSLFHLNKHFNIRL